MSRELAFKRRKGVATPFCPSNLINISILNGKNYSFVYLHSCNDEGLLFRRQ